MGKKYDFCGWATRANVKCADGRTIMNDAFKDDDGITVPLVWNHQHNEPWNVLGHALLKNTGDGVYMYGSFNNTESGQDAKLIVEHGDVTGLSIYANKLKQVGGNVLHGAIREVSLVLAGANPDAKIEEVITQAYPIFIEDVLEHGDDAGDTAIIYNFSATELELSHGDDDIKEEENGMAEDKQELKHAEAESKESKESDSKESDSKEKTVKEIFDTLTEEQRNAVNTVVAYILSDGDGEDEDDDEGESEDMKHNVFESDQENNENVLSHSEMMAIIDDAEQYGSMKKSALQHGIEGIDWLFPEAKSLDNPPKWIDNQVEWVKTVLGGVHHTPFSRVKSMFADIREDEARAKGYIKGDLKQEEVFSLLRRQTDPQTIYKTQKFDRDDVIDITDFDVVAWVKGEMRNKLDEEIARAILIGDGKLTSDRTHISHDHVRPIYNDANLFTIKRTITAAQNATDDEKARAFERECVKARKDYRGSGTPTLFTTEDWLTTMLLREDNIGRRIHATEAELATALRVGKIVTVSAMENMKGALGGDLAGIIVNLADYNVGADKGGAVSLFDDFDIDYNKMTYLIETRMSGALTVPYSAIAIEFNPVESSYDYAGGVEKSKQNQSTGN